MNESFICEYTFIKYDARNANTLRDPMPKDLVHFAVAERTAALLASTRYATCLAPGHGLLLGAVFHDALFYATPPSGTPLERLAHRLHGADGEDTFTLIRLQAEHAAEADTLLARSLLVGMVSHLYADAVMHPLVWHLSGDYYSPIPAEKSAARQRHRALEALMDMVVCPGMLGRSRYSLRLMLRRCPRILDGLPVSRLGSMANMPPSATASALGRAWATYAILQAAYSNRFLARTAFTLRPALPRPAAELSALFYAPQLLRQADALTGPVTFLHPVTGRSNTTSLDELMDQAAVRAAALCHRLEPAVFDSARLDLDDAGPSMDAGLPGVSTREMLHFARPPFPRLD